MFYVTLSCKTERKCSIMQAPFIRKHYFGDVCEASQVKSGSSSSAKHTCYTAKSIECEQIKARSHILLLIFFFYLMHSPFPCSKFAGLTASSLPTGRIPQPLFEIFRSHFAPTEAPDQRSLGQRYVFGVWTDSMCSEVSLHLSSEAYPAGRISLRYPP